jgi:hypothetical protein
MAKSRSSTEPAGNPAKTTADKQPERVQEDKTVLPKYETSRSAQHRVLNQITNTTDQKNKRDVDIPEWLSSYVFQATAAPTEHPLPTGTPTMLVTATTTSTSVSTTVWRNPAFGSRKRDRQCGQCRATCAWTLSRKTHHPGKVIVDLGFCCDKEETASKPDPRFLAEVWHQPGGRPGRD